MDATGSRIIAYGKPSHESSETANGDTMFEIGSVTKVFTARLLADGIERGEMDLNDPIAKFLPQPVKTPTRKGRAITLLDLATHTSGLPCTPDKCAPANPLTDYSVLAAVLSLAVESEGRQQLSAYSERASAQSA